MGSNPQLMASYIVRDPIPTLRVSLSALHCCCRHSASAVPNLH